MFINSFIDCVSEEQHISFIFLPLSLVNDRRTRHILKAREGVLAFSTLKLKGVLGGAETKRHERRK